MKTLKFEDTANIGDYIIGHSFEPHSEDGINYEMSYDQGEVLDKGEITFKNGESFLGYTINLTKQVRRNKDMVEDIGTLCYIPFEIYGERHEKESVYTKIGLKRVAKLSKKGY